jgi:hypothetical protein
MVGDQQDMRPVDELAAELLKRGTPLRIKARGGSMTPFVRDGDVALVAPTRGRSVCIGDVICYETTAGKLLLHRVIARDLNCLVAKGDALAAVEIVDRTRLLGTVVAVERHGTITRLDTRIARWRNHVIAFLSPLFPPLLLLALRARGVWRAALHG